MRYIIWHGLKLADGVPRPSSEAAPQLKHRRHDDTTIPHLPPPVQSVNSFTVKMVVMYNIMGRQVGSHHVRAHSDMIPEKRNRR